MNQISKGYHIYRANYIKGYGEPYIIISVLSNHTVEAYILYTKLDSVDSFTLNKNNTIPDEWYGLEDLLNTTLYKAESIVYGAIAQSNVYNMPMHPDFENCKSQHKCLLDFCLQCDFAEVVFAKILPSKNKRLQEDLRTVIGYYKEFNFKHGNP